MTSEAFDVIVAKRIQSIREVLSVKAGEYAAFTDRLHNFKRASEIDPTRTPSQVCMGFAIKHWVSIADIVDDLAKGDQSRLLLTSEKIGDAINYLILLEALIAEQS